MYNHTSKATQKFHESTSFPVENQSSCVGTQKGIGCAYLRNEMGKYKALFLGNNGEPLAEQTVEVALNHRVTGRVNAALVTDKSGCVYLGHLNDVMNVEVHLKKYQVSR